MLNGNNQGSALTDKSGRDYLEEFISLVKQDSFPCIGAKAAVNSGAYQFAVYDELASSASSKALAADLAAFVASDMRAESDYATFVAVFRDPVILTEEVFERLLWTQLQLLHKIDEKEYQWDPTVSSDPADSHFSFSFAGEALYVVGMHQGSSRLSRRFICPALIFNPHAQFQRLRERGNWERMHTTIRSRDLKLQGTINPMLDNFGDNSEARQYSGRAVEAQWVPPFKASNTKPSGKCPFHSMST